MERKEITDGIEKMNRTIENYKESLKNLFFSISEDEEDRAFEKIYKNLVKIEIEANKLNYKVDKYLWDKAWSEEDE